MEINNALQQSTNSIRQAIGMANLRRSMHQDSQMVSTLISDMQSAQAKIMENSVAPHKGGSIDVRV